MAIWGWRTCFTFRAWRRRSADRYASAADAAEVVGVVVRAARAREVASLTRPNPSQGVVIARSSAVACMSQTNRIISSSCSP